MSLILDRMALDDAGANPVSIASAIHEQLGELKGAVDVHAVARALDIVEIREEDLESIEGALVTQPERRDGAILINRRSSRPRQRYTIAHELGHYLNPWHRPTFADGFRCRKSDMRSHNVGRQKWYWRQEAEANVFAVELLTPRARLKRHLVGIPDLGHVIDMARTFEISRESAARRYADLHSAALAVVFSKQGRVRYAERSRDFPAIALRKDDAIPTRSTNTPGMITDLDDVDPAGWAIRDEAWEIAAQTLHQKEGFAITMLFAKAVDESDTDIEDTYDRFSGLGER